MKKYFLFWTKTALILVYLVIVAGAFVRMTGSGMGCPDWPKCFGYYIPPTEIKELLYTPGKEYSKGQVIIKNEKLLVAKGHFVAANNFENTHWEKYTKHDYAVFNPYHTWVEFLNRLVGAIAGLATLILAFLSLRYWKEKKLISLLSFGVVLGMGFQAWLGATVVYSVLAPVKITTHMLMALAIVAALILIIQKANPRIERTKYMANFHKAISYLLFIFLLQIVFGTQVREFVDHQLDLGLTKDNWLLNPSIIFYVHRSFSILPLGIAVYLFWINKRNELGFASTKPLLAGMIIAAFSGMAMYYIDFPLGTQPIHLVIAAILFGQIFYIFLQSRKAKNNISKTK
mgnify:CR=1 FL=1